MKALCLELLLVLLAPLCVNALDESAIAPLEAAEKAKPGLATAKDVAENRVLDAALKVCSTRNPSFSAASSANFGPREQASMAAVLPPELASFASPEMDLVGPWKREAKLTRAQTQIFGYSTAVSGNTLAVGSYFGTKGVVYVFTGSQKHWSLVARLTASSEIADDAFGTAVAISGDTIVVGAYGVNQEQGAAYVFVKPTSGWKDMHETTKLTSSDGVPNDNFGFSVAADRDVVVVGALHAAQQAGTAYVFVKPESGWKTTVKQKAELTASDFGGWMGYSVAVNGDTIVAGAPIAPPFTEGGAAYIYVKSAKGWTNETEAAKLTASDETTGLLLGYAVGVSGDTVGATAPGDALLKGAVYLAVKPEAGWKNTTETAKLTARDGLRGYYFGASLAMNGNKLLAGAILSNNQPAPLTCSSNQRLAGIPLGTTRPN